MRKIILILSVFMAGTVYAQTNTEELSATIIALEKAALEKWNQGDPSGYLDLSADDVTYFDPSLEQRMDGLENLRNYYEPATGKISVDRYEMVNPNVTATNGMAVLTFNLFSYIGSDVHKWNCTEVYRLERDGQWKIVHTHWSIIQPNAK